LKVKHPFLAAVLSSLSRTNRGIKNRLQTTGTTRRGITLHGNDRAFVWRYSIGRAENGEVKFAWNGRSGMSGNVGAMPDCVVTITTVRAADLIPTKPAPLTPVRKRRNDCRQFWPEAYRLNECSNRLTHGSK
jgi:hypothetical protein